MKNKNILSVQDIKYREFPGLHFGVSDDSLVYFDATSCIREKGNEKIHSAGDFEMRYACWISAVSKSYGILPEDMTVRDTATGHLFIEESLALLFMAYIDPEFAVYMLERISEMFLKGIVLSDTALVMMARERLTVEDLT